MSCAKKADASADKIEQEAQTKANGIMSAAKAKADALGN